MPNHRFIAWLKALFPLLGLALFLPATVWGEATNLVANGRFDPDANGVPRFWQSAGDSTTVQQLTSDAGRAGGHSARLECTRMGRDTPSSHAMVCQVGRVSVQRGQWYRLTFWSKAGAIRNGAAYVGLSNTRLWNNVGLDEGFYPTPEWQRFEYVFEARESLPAEASRLQFWFKSTGTLWLADVELAETAAGRQWLPQWSSSGVPNLIPNSGFECGGANWGSYNNERGGWGNQLFQLVGAIVPAPDSLGGRCLKISLDPTNAPVFSFDYFDAVRRPVRRALAANLGWFRIEPGQPMVLSADLRAAQPGTAAQLAIIQAGGRTMSRTVQAGAQWQRFEFSFKPDQPFLFAAVGLDLESSHKETGTLWVDNVQLEPGSHATAWQPRQPVEGFLEAGGGSGIFSRVDEGLTLTLHAFDYSGNHSPVEGQLVITDFADRVVYRAAQTLDAPWDAQHHLQKTWRGLCAGKAGFYRATWSSPCGTNTVRCALIRPHDGSDSPIGMNHAYPWDFLVRSANLAGISWWRDWSAKWHVVEPEQGRFDFRDPDAQIQRVLNLGGRAIVLLPFPSALWSASHATNATSGRGGGEDILKTVAQAPKNTEDFGRYAAAVAQRYRGRSGVFEILNEPLYTSYALPRGSGYKMEDYLSLVQAAYRAIKGVDPKHLVVGGIGTGPNAGLSLEFIEKGGLDAVDVFNLHMYEPPIPAVAAEEAFGELERCMQQHGGSKPVWITEYGCYADDDPACVPVSVGDASMNRSKWPSEQAAAEHMVQYAAVTFAHGVRKILFHAGEGGQVNSVDASGVFFEYGGEPRKMYPAVAALTRLLGTPDECLGTISQGEARAYLFRRGERSVAVAWTVSPRGFALKDAPRVNVFDIMGNRIKGRAHVLGATPVYLLDRSRDARNIRAALGR